MRNTEPLPSFQGVAANAKATLNIPRMGNIHGITLTRGGTFTHAQLGLIRLLIDGDPVWETEAADLDIMQQFDGLQAASSTISYIDFERNGLLAKAWIEATAIDARMQKTLALECNIGAATNPTLTAKAEITYGALPDTRILKRRTFTRVPTGAGVYEINDLPFGTADRINRIWIKAAGGNLSGVKMRRNNTEEFDRTSAENDYIQTNGVRVPQTNWFVIDPSEKGFGNLGIVTEGLNQFRLDCTMSAADTLTLYVDYLGLPGSGS